MIRRLGDIRLGTFRLRDIRLGVLRLGDVRLEHIRLGDIRLGDSLQVKSRNINVWTTPSQGHPSGS